MERQTPKIIRDLLEILQDRGIRYAELSDCVVVPFIKAEAGDSIPLHPSTFYRNPSKPCVCAVCSEDSN